jgi:3-oxoacyl-[acyl-carrier-protein] synthase II
MTTPLPTGDSSIRAIRRALEDAQVGPEQIDYINAHASSTPMGDATEVVAIREVFGERAPRIPVSGTKPYTAHPLGATGAMEAAICALALENNWVPPTLAHEHPDCAHDLDFVPNHGRDLQLSYVLSNSFGFGGINACIVLGRVR